MYITRQFTFQAANALSYDLLGKIHMIMERFVLLADTASSTPNYDITVTDPKKTSYMSSDFTEFASYWASIPAISSVTIEHSLTEPGLLLMSLKCIITGSETQISIGVDTSIENDENAVSSFVQEVLSAIS